MFWRNQQAQKNIARTLRILVSSPGDVAVERERAREVIDKLNRRYAGQVVLQALLWEDFPLEPNASFQQGIEAVLSQQAGIDVAIFILWLRLGTVLGGVTRKADGSQYRSGTEREFDLMLAARSQSGGERPRILVYLRKDQQAYDRRLTDEGHKGDQAVEEFISQKRLLAQFVKERFEHEGGHNLGAYHAYSSPADFGERLETHLSQLLRSLVPEARRRRLKQAVTKLLTSAGLVFLSVAATVYILDYRLGAIVITSEPANALIMVDGSLLGATPYTNSYMRPGFLSLRIEKEGFESENVNTRVTAQDTKTLNVALRAQGKIGSDISLSANLAHLLHAQGQVSVTKAGMETEIPATVPMNLHSGDSVRTAENSTALIGLADQTQFRMRELSTLTMLSSTPKEDSPVLNLVRGTLYFFKRDKATNINIRTPQLKGATRG